MSVGAASSAVSTQQHQPTQEQIRLARLIEDKKHDQPEVQEIVRKVLDIVTDSNQEDALLALFDCDYDFERAVALLIEKGHEVASEWRTATNHKLTKKQQQQQKVAATKNGHGDLDENGHQRGNGHTSRGKFRRFQQNGGDSQNGNNQVSNENSNPQQRQRGGSGYRGRNRGNNRGGFRGTDRNYHSQQHQQTQDLNIDNSSPSDTNRRNRNPAVSSGQQQPQEQWDVGNWNGETLIYSRTTNDDEPQSQSEDSSKVINGQSDSNNQQQSKSDFDPIEAARQIKNVIGIGQTSKSSISDQQQQQQQQKSKATTGQSLTTKVTPPPQPRIPQQPVIFSDHFDGGMNKIDVQFGNLDEPSSTAFYQSSKSIPSNKVSQRTTEQSAHISSAIRPTDQPVMNHQQQRILPTQIQQQQQQTIPIKHVVTPQYAVHQQQHQLNPPNVLLQSLLYHHQQAQVEPVTLDTSYDPTTYSLPSMDFNSPYFMAAPPQQQAQPRYLVSQAPPPPQQQQQQQQQTTSKPAQTPSGSASTTSTGTKKAPAVPPGMFPPTAVPPLAQQPAYSAAYGVQQQTGGTTYSTPYDTEHLFANSFIPLTNPQQAQSPTGTYGSVTPPNQQQQQANNNNDNKTINYRPPLAENLMLLQQYQQFALQQTNSQQQGQQPAAHSQATLSYFLGHPPSGASYPPGHQIMYATAPTTLTQQQQPPKQQGQQYNQNNSSTGIGGNDDYYGRNSSSSNKEGQYLYAAGTQPQHGPAQSTGQQHGVNKQQQQQQRPSGNAYNNHQGQQRPYR